MTNSEFSYLSSSIVKEIFMLNGCIHGLVPEQVIEAMEAKINLKKGDSQR
jgi:pantetheine-phosphate adenylyltransferase